MKAHPRHRANPDKSLVGFSVGGTAYAVPIQQVWEVVNPMPLSHLPHGGGALAGAVEHRGQLTVLVDLRCYFGLQASNSSLRPKWVLMRGVKQSLGFVVDEVTGVLGTQGQPLSPAPSPFGGEAPDFLGVFSRQGLLVFVLDVRHFESLALVSPPGDKPLLATRSPLT
jgi:purine-binding chemotaxis protein CheW